MGRRSYIYAHSSASSDSDSESSSSAAAPPRRYRKRRTPPSPRHASQSPAISPSPTPHPPPAAVAVAVAGPEGGSSSNNIDTPSLHSTSGTSSASDDKKKKKNKAAKPPQESIDKIWERFSQKKFSKALAVLPFAPVPASTSGERGNELLSAGFERAAEECRRKVRKIIAECKRVNTRYRDPGWDLDWDFKWAKGHCLNSLGRTKFDINHANLIKPSSNIPKAVKRVNDIYEKPTFMANILPGDIKQGSLGNCWFVASLTGLANVEDGIKRICVEYDTKIGIYGFVFYRDGEWIYSIIDDKLYLRSPCWDSQSMQRELLQQIDREDVERVYRQTYQTGSKALFFAQNKDQNETWVPLIEKAYAKAHGDFACLSGGWIGEALEDLSGGVTTELLASDIFDTDAFWDNELSRVNQEFLFGCATGLLDAGYGDRDGVLEGHAYVLMEARTLKDGTRLCKLRNPWGKVKKGNWEGAWSDGSKEWTTEVQQELGHTFGGDSTFWISYEDLLRKYQHFDRTRLFRDRDWRACQRWIGVEVTWKPQYHEKFHIKLTRESPLVLVLSQLDTRYFRGLQGQYNFRLQFRVHEEGRPGAEEYVVRSHGNYLMDRSVSIELPSLEPGSYVVYISVVGERNTRLPSTEEVIKRECKGREENEKLAQVGQAYDLAHSKAASHLQRLAKVRKHAESKKASESRKKERRKNWKQRQTGREINKKQKAKDDAKKAALKAEKKAKAEADKKAKAEAEAEAAENASPPSSSSSSTTSSSTSTPQYTPQDTPKPEHAEPAAPAVVSGGPPATTLPTIPEQKPLEVKVHCCHSSCKTPPKAEETDYSSDSPVEDYEQLYDSDDMTPTLRMAGTAATTTTANEADSDDEDLPEPWNAIAVIGFRVYSKDEDLELRVIMEGGELEHDGMGNLGEADLDNAVSNAAGQRERKKREEKAKKQAEEAAVAAAAAAVAAATAAAADSNAAPGGPAQLHDADCPDDTSENGLASYRTIIERKTSEFDRVMGKVVQAPAQSQTIRTAVVDSSKPQEPATNKAASPVVSAAAAAATTPTKTTTTQDAPQRADTSAEEAKTPSSGTATHVVPAHAWPTTTQKMVLHIRHRLQKGMVSRWGHIAPEVMPEMAKLLTQLEAQGDLEADILESTRIYKVLTLILKAEIPRDDEFSFSARVQALVDDYELTLISANPNDKGYFLSRPDISRNSSGVSEA